jgi:pro-kumamolisin-like protein
MGRRSRKYRLGVLSTRDRPPSGGTPIIYPDEERATTRPTRGPMIGDIDEGVRLRRSMAYGIRAIRVSRLLGAVVVVAAAVAFTSGNAASAPLSTVRVSQLSPGTPPPGSTYLGSVPETTPLDINVVLAPEDESALNSLLTSISDPTSPSYHRFLARGQFTQDFAPSANAVSTAESWLRSKGLSVTRSSTFSLSVSGATSAVSTAFGVTFHRFRTADGVTGRLASAAPLLPRGLANGEITGVLGLDTLETPTSDLASDTSGSIRSSTAQPEADGLTPCAGAAGAAGTDYYTFDTLGSAYGFGPLLGAGLNGSGETIALYELGAHSASDVATYETCFGLRNPVATVGVDGGPTGGVTVEADTDIEEAATEAPGASLVSYEGPDTTAGAYDVWTAIVSADSAQVISTSWGVCELGAVDAGTFDSTDTLLKQAALQGQTVLAASGDSGSEGCYRANHSTTLYTTFPAEDPAVTAVGGSTLFAPGDEIAWNDCDGTTGITCAENGGSAGGGGLSRYADIPSWQPSVWHWTSSTNPCGEKCRQTPDISSNAGVGMVSYYDGSWVVDGGTSLAAPLIAGLVADRNTGCRSSTGLFTPALYGLYNQGGYGTALNQITTGDNDLTRTYGGTQYPAGAGYNAATGLGSPIAGGLACAEVTTAQNGYVGQEVTLDGLGLEHATIYYGSTEAQVVAASATQATVVIPEGSGTVEVSATSIMGAGTEDALFTYTSPPRSTSAPTPTPTPTPTPAPTRTPTPIPSPMTVSGYDMVGSDGGVFVFPSGQSGGYYGSLPGDNVDVSDIVGMVPTPSDTGYFLVGADGGVFAFGNAPYLGSLPGDHVSVADIKAIVPTSDNKGYFLVGADGGVFTFGDAPFLGSLPGSGVHVSDVVGIAATPTDEGYWLVTSTGHVYSYGNATNFGSAPGSSAVSGIDSTPDGGGYWVVTQNGGVYTFGDAGYFGSLPQSGVTPSEPVIGLVPTSDEKGYWLIGSDGGIFAYGDASFQGSLPQLGVNVADVVGAVPTK